MCKSLQSFCAHMRREPVTAHEYPGRVARQCHEGADAITLEKALALSGSMASRLHLVSLEIQRLSERSG
jgi:hypothetical protein